LELEQTRHLNTVKDYLLWSEQQLINSDIYLGHGFDNHWDESLALLLHVKAQSWDVDNSFLIEQVSEKEKLNFVELLRKRIEEKIPVAYLVNEAWFLGLAFTVNTDVLIPRSPIAELIEDGFSLWFQEKSPESILDLCTGSGCIGITCALMFEEASVDLSDISSNALSLAKLNRQKYALENRVNVIESDLFKGLIDKTYELIVCNPPYVDAQDMASLPAEYLHEPRMALQAGEDGLDLVTSILQQAANHLSENGLLIMEVGNSEHALCEQFPKVPFLWLDFERGGHGVFALTRDQLAQSF
jgi:ribosomal protein L3 glutamine methyltransferase